MGIQVWLKMCWNKLYCESKQTMAEGPPCAPLKSLPLMMSNVWDTEFRAVGCSSKTHAYQQNRRLLHLFLFSQPEYLLPNPNHNTHSVLTAVTHCIHDSTYLSTFLMYFLTIKNINILSMIDGCEGPIIDNLRGNRMAQSRGMTFRMKAFGTKEQILFHCLRLWAISEQLNWENR